MMIGKIKFNPLDWVENQETKQSFPAIPAIPAGGGKRGESHHQEADFTRVEQLIDALEKAQIDITNDYNDWYKIGIALASAFGERGREYFHRISKLYYNYNYNIVNNKYNQCMHNPSPQITLGTVFHLAKKAGVILPASEPAFHSSPCSIFPQVAGMAGMAGNAVLDEHTMQLPYFQFKPEELPPFMQPIYGADSDPVVAGMLFFGAIVALSAVMPNVSGIYGRKIAYTNLYGFIAAPPASSKGKLTDVIRLVQPIQDEIREANELEFFKYNEQLAANKVSGDRSMPPKAPKYRTLRIAANASSTALYQALNDNDGAGLTFETEGDTLTSVLKTDFGNYSDGLRKAFHHEPISYLRRKDNEHVDIKRPRWSVLLSGTYGQISALIPNSENGLFSRFPFYCLLRNNVWIDVFDNTEDTLENLFLALGKRYLPLYHVLKCRQTELHMKLTTDQQTAFNSHFEAVQKEYASLYGDDLIASVRRQGLIAFRFMMVLSITRFADAPFELTQCATITCNDEDFHTALHMSDVLLQHTAFVFSQCLVPIENKNPIDCLNDIQNRFYHALPSVEFGAEEWGQCAANLKISLRTAEKWIGKFVSKLGLLTRVARGRYIKSSNE